MDITRSRQSGGPMSQAGNMDTVLYTSISHTILLNSLAANPTMEMEKPLLKGG